MKNKSSDNQTVETIFRLLGDASSIDTLLDSSPELFNETFFTLLRKLIQDAFEKHDIGSAMRLSVLAKIVCLSMEVKGIAPQDETWWNELEAKKELIFKSSISTSTSTYITQDTTHSGTAPKIPTEYITQDNTHSGTAPKIPTGNVLLRDWWHRILRQYGHYPSYAMMLSLPADSEAIRYQTEFGKELHLVTSNNCLVITLTGLGFMQYGADDRIMPLAVDESIAEGYCLNVAELFNVKFNQFPCLILFRDIRKPEHVLVTLKGLDAEGIAEEMRILFSVVNEAVKQDKDPITVVEQYNKQQTFSGQRKAIWSSVRSFTGKTLEKMMEALVKANIN